VFGVPNKRVGEEVAVWIKLKPNTQLSFEDLQKFCNGNIASFKTPKHMKIVDAFPTNPNGKLLRHKIIETAISELGSKS
jgi:fatty-acyl-CoA synthase